MIRAQNVAKWVSSPQGRLDILQPLDLAIADGEHCAIVGPSGSGKTTLLALLAGLDLPSAGRLWLAGEELTALDEDARAALRRQHVGFVFQNFQLLDTLTALDNVALPLELRGDRDARARARDMLARVGLAERAHHYSPTLSGGEQQRVALARAFVGRPQVLFADEPTGSLDRASAQAVQALMFELNRAAGTTLVIVTHDEALAAHADRRLQLTAGRLTDAA
ncbi:ABC transporter ATP-binding protein [Immundisolibacter sp.]|uniref:ABC transporter ATP-binding protein n=1 Tax=Immundisolibacter sp. TaxID=1934948 RepID=UPI00261EDA99|nr:ABC transporter ATP-binding protein [Immundisolibacter sp.]MDD3651972.1 ABC transporter ATP-binding protein [Immundisolibacter sp.]